MALLESLVCYRMEAARLNLSLTQEDMARKLDVTQATYSRTEKRATRASEAMLDKIAEILDVPKDGLYEKVYRSNLEPAYLDDDLHVKLPERCDPVLTPNSIPDILRELKRLLDESVITEREFQKKKEELLARI